MSRDRVLLVEDDKEMRRSIKILLKGQGYVVFQATDGIEGPKMPEDNEIDLAIVGMMMLRVGGVTMTAKLREKHGFLIVFLFVKSEEVNKILGLNMGADDCIIKPFTPMELLARVNSRLRRYYRLMGRLSSKQAESPKIHRLGGLEVNKETAEVTMGGSCVKVMSIEFKILLLLIQNPGHVFPAEEIYERVRNERVTNTGTVMVHTRNLREKIEVSPREPKYVKVVWRVRYKIEKQS